MTKNKIKKIKGEHIQVNQEGNFGNSTEDVNGKDIVITQKTSKSNKSGAWSKWGSIGTWVSIAVAIVIAFIKCH